MFDEVEVELEKALGESTARLLAEADRHGYDLCEVEMPDGSTTVMAQIEVAEDGQYANRRNARAGWHTMFAKVEGKWEIIAQTYLQSYCAVCKAALVKFINKATDEEISNLRGSSWAWLNFLYRLKAGSCGVLAGVCRVFIALHCIVCCCSLSHCHIPTVS
jgi:hypothetical protein